MVKTLKALIYFAKRPSLDFECKTIVKETIKENFIIFITNLVLTFLVSNLVTIAIISFNISTRYTSDGSVFFRSVLILGIINYLIWPILEELNCRLYLKFKPINISITVFISLFSFISFFYQSPVLELKGFFFVKFFLSVVVSICAYLAINKIVTVRSFCAKIWVEKFKYIFYFSVITFGLYHVRRYSLSPVLYLIVPLLIMPQLISGIIWGYVRVKYGIIWSIIHHIMHNVCFYVPIIILQHYK